MEITLEITGFDRTPDGYIWRGNDQFKTEVIITLPWYQNEYTPTEGITHYRFVRCEFTGTSLGRVTFDAMYVTPAYTRITNTEDKYWDHKYRIKSLLARSTRTTKRAHKVLARSPHIVIVER